MRLLGQVLLSGHAQQAGLDIWPESLFFRASMGMGVVYSFPSSPLYAEPCRGPRRALVLPVVTAGHWLRSFVLG